MSGKGEEPTYYPGPDTFSVVKACPMGRESLPQIENASRAHARSRLPTLAFVCTRARVNTHTASLRVYARSLAHARPHHPHVPVVYVGVAQAYNKKNPHHYEPFVSRGASGNNRFQASVRFDPPSV